MYVRMYVQYKCGRQDRQMTATNVAASADDCLLTRRAIAGGQLGSRRGGITKASSSYLFRVPKLSAERDVTGTQASALRRSRCFRLNGGAKAADKLNCRADEWN